MQKGFSLILILIGILVLVGVAGGVYFLGRFDKSEQVTSQPQPITQPSFVPQASSADETVYTEGTRSANWKTYTNTKYRYSFKYPPKLTSIELSLDKEDMVVTIAGKSEGSTDEGYYTGLIRISSFAPGDLLYDSDETARELLNLQIDDQYQPPDRMVGGITRTYSTYKRLSDVTIGGLQAKVFENSKTVHGGVWKRFYINEGKYTYLIESEFLPSQAQYFPQELYDQILSTFKFE